MQKTGIKVQKWDKMQKNQHIWLQYLQFLFNALDIGTGNRYLFIQIFQI